MTDRPLFAMILDVSGLVIHFPAECFTAVRDVGGGIYRRAEYMSDVWGYVIYSPELDAELRRLGFIDCQNDKLPKGESS